MISNEVLKYFFNNYGRNGFDTNLEKTYDTLYESIYDMDKWLLNPEDDSNTYQNTHHTKKSKTIEKTKPKTINIDYKEFGIYVNDSTVSVIVKIIKDKIIGIKFPTSAFDTLSNKCINDTLSSFVDFNKKTVFSYNLKKSPDIFIDNGYLGQINSSDLQNEFKDFIMEYLMKEC